MSRDRWASRLRSSRRRATSGGRVFDLADAPVKVACPAVPADPVAAAFARMNELMNREPDGPTGPVLWHRRRR